MESNFRGCRSESGILTANSDSSAATRSASVKESSNPDSNSDSSGEGSTGLSAIRRMMARILLFLSMWFLVCDGRPAFYVELIGAHDVLEKRFGETMIAGGGEVDIVALGESRVQPVFHRTAAAHALAHV